jgi:hypothetical protein
MLDALPSEPANDATIQVERFANIVEGLHHLFSDMWSDISRDQALPPMDVDYGKYVHLDTLGVLRTVTVRWKGELVGVMVLFVAPNLHHRTSRWATCDAIWVRTDMRRPLVGMRLIRFAEEMMLVEGVNVIRMAAKIKRPALGRLLAYMDYVPVEVQYQKVLR